MNIKWPNAWNAFTDRTIESDPHNICTSSFTSGFIDLASREYDEVSRCDYCGGLELNCDHHFVVMNGRFKCVEGPIYSYKDPYGRPFDLFPYDASARGFFISGNPDLPVRRCENEEEHRNHKYKIYTCRYHMFRKLYYKMKVYLHLLRKGLQKRKRFLLIEIKGRPPNYCGASLPTIAMRSRSDLRSSQE